MLIALAKTASAQEPMEPSSEISGYVRLLELEGKVSGTPLVYWASSLRPRVHGLHADSVHLWSARYALMPAADPAAGPTLSLLDPHLRAVYSSAFPRTSNDGAAWAGKGVSGIVQGGAQIEWGPFTGRLYPSFVYAQNRAFALGTGPQSGRSVYAYPWENGIDFPQRFGNSALAFLDWGQSEARMDFHTLTAGFSTENLWWGPGYRNAIIMGNPGPGFPHFDLGTGRSVRTPIGDFEFRGVWGALSRSEFFGAASGDGRRILSGLTAAYRPRFLPGLTVGVTRALYHEWPADGLGASDFTDVFGVIFNPGKVQPNGEVLNDTRDQLASLVARWVLPAAGFEAYFEYARNDFAGSLKDLLVEPDHSRAATLGFQKSLPSGDGNLVFKGEITSLGKAGTFQLRDEPTFYVHYIAIEGYTNRGQLLGAAIGPGSNSQYLGLDRYTSRGRYGVFFERIRYDDDYAFAALRTVPFGYLSHQVDLTLGVSTLRFTGALDWGAGLELTREFNRYFVRNQDVTNLKLSLNLGWHRQ